MRDLHGDPLGIELHSGVARFMKSVYAWTVAGVALTAATAIALGYSSAAVEALREAPGTGLMWPVLAVLTLACGTRLHQLSPRMARVAFLGFSALFGAALAWIGAVTSLEPHRVGISVGLAGVVFALLALFGSRTRRDLSGWGPTLMAALLGSIFAIVIDLSVLRSAGVLGLDSGIQALLCGIFAGFVAHDTQKIKQIYRASGPRDNLAVVGALKLYLDFVNLLLASLRLLGGYR
ncbi:MAG: Bax inhibitor-1/YccA family protein [Nannocystis sp.]|nr:Bax inhibitor-1/YccA family protein [Nannocystis sp.]MBA3550425.1 Bax inhibitor-1/YccA family protein [Nannocystis sp.]